ncbi:Tim44/TimA family protein [Rickettsiales endosymbiont of Paramecium tredecaurelia]|uniref:hypothetical protein n=1 Tax=Candidatus Sarmatiella mevalonica TaxID=2770581 RepID=UPI0019239F7B|nr:hypothetical protein [Candidatus Sarmatiella mevalonica]MBL3284272.1 Tim44/TimA family protein [Candidatus Sarmatiella mevalonica]
MILTANLIELIIWASLALLLINKLISILGIQDEPELAHSLTQEEKIYDVNYDVKPKDADESRDFFDQQNAQVILENYHALLQKQPSFTMQKFLKGAYSVFKLMVQEHEKEEELMQLADKQVITKVKENLTQYTKLDLAQLQSKITEIYIFANKAYIRVCFWLKNDFNQEWVFTKNLDAKGNDWHLSSID